jgi:hypothetical protein
MTGKQTRMKWITLSLPFLFLITGCAHEMRRFPAAEEAAPPPRHDAPAPRFPQQPEELKQRIEAVQAILRNPDLSIENRLLAQDLLRSYQAFERASLRPLDEETRSVNQLLLSSLMQLDERYFTGLLPEKQDGTRDMTLFSEKRKALLDRYLTGDYEGVVEKARELEDIFGPRSLTPDIGLVFAISLAKRGMVQEALRVGTGIIDDLERIPGDIEFRARTVEWQMALGDRKGAVRSYEKLVDRLHETEAFVKTAGGKMSEQGLKGAYEIKREDPRGLSELAGESHSLEEVLGRVDALVQKNDFEAAKLLLLRLSIRLQGGAEAERIDRAMRAVETAEKKSWEQERADVSQKQEVLEIATGLIEQERYEEAIAQIETSTWGKEFGPEARQLQELAVEKIVNRQRNEAAKLFLMARNTQDPAKKEQLLIDSQNILKSLLDKYPSTPLKQTINGNIQRIEEELSKVRRSS